MNSRKIDLVWIGSEAPPSWPEGAIHRAARDPAAVAAVVERELPASTAEAWLFWEARLGCPDPAIIRRVLGLPGQVWHGGLLMGLKGLPGLLDFVVPTWPLNCDPPADRECTSWRLTPRLCLVQTSVLRRCGSWRPDFQSLDASGLEAGLRWIRAGVITRHVPWLVSVATRTPAPVLSLQDEFRIVAWHYGRRWTYWAAFRAVLTGYAPASSILRAVRLALASPAPRPADPFWPQFPHNNLKVPPRKVSVVIPTLQRYSHLRRVLCDLTIQTVRPHEVIVVDQTPVELRETDWLKDFEALPLRVLYLDRPGQSSARNAALRCASGELILFLDDDVELPDDLLERHLKAIEYFRADSSSGAVRVPRYSDTSHAAAVTRVSDVFPTSNTLVKRAVLRSSGLFDLAYDRREGADGDLGLRLHLSGALLMFVPWAQVVHHHAPSGGLRAHKARIHTYAESRMRLLHRRLPTASEIYRSRRYFQLRQVREELWQAVVGTFALRGSAPRRLLKCLLSGVLLPDTAWKLWKAWRGSSALMRDYPQIDQDATVP